MPTVHLCFDFGTAFSKAFAWRKDDTRPLVLKLGSAAGVQVGSAAGVQDMLVRTALSISDEGIVHFGDAAMDKPRPFTDIKQTLTSATRHSELSEPIPKDFNKTNRQVTKLEAITLYFTFLTHIALKAIGKRGGNGEYVERSVTTPVFHPKKHRWVQAEISQCAVHAQLLADKFGDELLHGPKLKDLMNALRGIERRKRLPGHLVKDGLQEPIAAIAARMVRYTHDNNPYWRRVMVVVDVGAGTTDFGAFIATDRYNDFGVWPIKGTKSSLSCAGNDIDVALIEYAMQESGRSNDRKIRAEVERDVKFGDVKERLFNPEREGVDDWLVGRQKMRIDRDQFMDCDLMQNVVRKIEREFDNVLRTPAVLSWVDMNLRREVDVFFSGGGAYLPFLSRLASNQGRSRYLNTDTNGMVEVRPRAAALEPTWSNEPGLIYTWRRIRRSFPQMAVSLGGAYFGGEGNKYLRLNEEIGEH